MILSINDFFKCPLTLARLHNCGYLSSYLNSFAEWMANQQFSAFILRFHISNVAHLSQSWKVTESNPDMHDIHTHIKIFLNKHIPTCKCKGWKQPRKAKYISHSLNQFKKYLTDCHGFDFKSGNLAYPEIHNEYLRWLSEEFKLENSSIRLRSSCRIPHYM